MERTPINPWNWSLNLGYNQGEVISGATRQLNCAGQTAVDADGTPQHEGDMRAQIALVIGGAILGHSSGDIVLSRAA